MTEMTMIDPEAVRRRMVHLRTIADMKQGDVGAELGVTQGAISHAERNPETLTIERINALADVLNVSAFELLFGQSDAVDLAVRLSTGQLGAVVFPLTQNA